MSLLTGGLLCLTDSSLCLAAIALTLLGGQPFALNIKKSYLNAGLAVKSQTLYSKP